MPATDRRNRFLAFSIGILVCALLFVYTDTAVPTSFCCILFTAGSLLFGYNRHTAGCNSEYRHKAGPLLYFFAFLLGFSLMAVRANAGEWLADAQAEAFSDRQTVWLFETVDYADSAGRLTCRVRSTDGSMLSVKVSVYADSDTAAFAPGTRFTACATLIEPTGTGRLYAFRNRIRLQGYGLQNVTVLRTGDFSLRYTHRYLRHRMTNLCDTLFKEMGWLARGLLFGDKSAFPDGFSAAAANAGVSHLFAVSGLHLSILCAALLSFGAGKPAKLASGAVCLIFTAISGFSASVIRACVMQLAALIAGLTGRDTDRYAPFAAALSLLLLCNVWAVSDMGLQFSFISVLGILLWGTPLTQQITALIKKPKDRKRNVLRRTVQSVLISLVCSLITLPLTALYYNRISLIGIFTNLILEPVLPPLFLGCFATVLLGLIWSPLGKIPGFVLIPMLKAVQKVITFLSSLSFSTLGLRSLFVIPALLLLLLLWAAVFSKRPQQRHILSAAALSLLILAGAAGAGRLVNKNTLTVTQVDMGEGRCTVVQQGNSVAVIDCACRYGTPSEKLTDCLLAENIRSIDLLIVTYSDVTERSGAEYLLRSGNVKRLMLAAYSGDEESAASLLALAEERQIPTEILTADTRCSLGNALLRIFVPAQSGTARGTALCQISFQGASVWVTGKTSADGQVRVLETRDTPLPDLILAAGETGHCVSEALIEACDTGLVSVSCNSPVTFEQDTVLYTTAESGTLQFLFCNGRIRFRRL